MNSEVQNPSEEIGESEAADFEQAVVSPRKRVRFFREFIILLVIVFMVGVFRSVVFEPFKIPTGSMIPTLRIGDLILVNKFAYGFKLPFSDLTLFSLNLDPIYLFGEDKVKRGDVIVFKYPQDPSINYIKRVIGLPGDTVEIKNKVVFINGKPLKTKDLAKETFMPTMDEKFKDNNLSFFEVETKETSFVYQVDDDNFFKGSYEKRTVPENQYFVMGDNRDYSYDSRYWGFVPHEYIKGRAFLVWLSLTSGGNDGDMIFRTERIGQLIK